MNEQGPKKGKIIQLNPENLPTRIDVVNALLDGELSFPDDQKEKQEELERLKKLMTEAKTQEEKNEIEFAIRQLLFS